MKGLFQKCQHVKICGRWRDICVLVGYLANSKGELDIWNGKGKETQICFTKEGKSVRLLEGCGWVKKETFKIVMRLRLDLSKLIRCLEILKRKRFLIKNMS